MLVALLSPALASIRVLLGVTGVWLMAIDVMLTMAWVLIGERYPVIDSATRHLRVILYRPGKQADTG
ncbi:uncharacterized protein PST29_4607 [Pseudomonas sp. St29]|nr:uncharacterized protein PST29_4607 [Pseudomonas sp. St29]